jgi:hypothetical protein
LRAILAGTAAEEARASVEQHLDTCALCRSRLELLAGSAEDLRRLESSEATVLTPVTPALEGVIRHFTAVPQDGLNEPTTELDPTGIMQFLKPPQQKGNLGRFGDYEVIEVVAAGGMGIVFKALDTTLNRIVALKVLAPVLVPDARARQRFIREARAAAAIDHHHVVRIFAVGEANELPFIAMEFVKGESLAARLKRDGRLPIEEGIRLGKEIAAGLAAAHARGIVHRDIKPANILIEGEDGRVKITDFGLARAVDDTELTRSGFIVGTPEYLSPEQAAGQAVEPRSDLFSLGCLLYAVFTGESPFRAATTLATLRRVADYTPPPARRINTDVPDWLSDLISRLMAKDPATRPATATELIMALEAGARGELGQSGPVLRIRRRAMLAALGASSLLALVLLATARFGSPTGSFIVLGRNGKALGAHDELEQALAQAPAGATVELCWNGEREIKPMSLPAHPLVLRAGRNFRPVWIHRGSGTNAALTARAALTLEGIEFRNAPSGSPAFSPPEREKEAEQRPGRGLPGISSSFVRSLGPSLHVRRCLMEHNGKLGARFAGIALEEVRECTVRDSEILFETGKAIAFASPLKNEDPKPVSGSGTNSLVISNCLLLASECIWMGLRHTIAADLRLERSSFKGKSFLMLVPGGTDDLTVDAQNNLFNPAVVLMDPRREGPAPLEHRLEWTGRTNLFCAIEYLLVFEVRPDRDIVRLEDWRTFWGRTETSSRQAKAYFHANARGREAFRLTDLRAVDGGPELTREHWSRFGADLDAVGPAASGTAHR